MLAILILICSQIDVCKIVGHSIDSLEARKYSLFEDIEGFGSAQFYESGDSIIVRLYYLEQRTEKDSAVTIDRETFKSLGSYIQHFRMIIEDEHFRKTFVQTYKIGWPIVSQNDIDRITKSSKSALIQDAACCMTGGCALGAYGAALLTRDIRTEIDTVGLPAPCLTGEGVGCTFIPVQIERQYYSFSEAAYITGAGIGSGLGYLWTRKKHKSYEVLYRAVGQDIVAFDDQGFPITETQIAKANRGTNEALLGTLGLAGGLVCAAGTSYALLAPWLDKHAEEEWQGTAITAAAVVLSAVEFVILSKFFINRGRQIDRQATIEKLKRRSH